MSSPRFAHPLAPVEADIDEVGHVSNLVYVRWILETAMAHSRACGWDYADYRASGAIFVVRRYEIDYLSSVVLGQPLRAETWIEDMKGVSCRRGTELVRLADGQVACRAMTTWAFISMASGRPQRIPDALRAAFVGP